MDERYATPVLTNDLEVEQAAAGSHTSTWRSSVLMRHHKFPKRKQAAEPANLIGGIIGNAVAAFDSLGIALLSQNADIKGIELLGQNLANSLAAAAIASLPDFSLLR